MASERARLSPGQEFTDMQYDFRGFKALPQLAHDPEASWFPCQCWRCKARDRNRWERRKVRGQVVE
jgi:hypothetical protein